MKEYKVKYPELLSSWKDIAIKEITRWLTDDDYQNHVTENTLKNDNNPPGPFTKFLYHFAGKCECGWGVMIDFNERAQRVYLTNHYYQWMHKLRDKIVLTTPRR